MIRRFIGGPLHGQTRAVSDQFHFPVEFRFCRESEGPSRYGPTINTFTYERRHLALKDEEVTYSEVIFCDPNYTAEQAGEWIKRLGLRLPRGHRWS